MENVKHVHAVIAQLGGQVVAEGLNRWQENPIWHGEIDAINRCAREHQFSLCCDGEGSSADEATARAGGATRKRLRICVALSRGFNAQER